MTLAIYPGSFDPVTNGHIDIIERAAKIYDELIVAVLINENKNPMFSIRERMDLIRRSISHLENVKVDAFEGLLVNYLQEKNIDCIVRGLRAMSDFENEFQMAIINKKLYHEAETVFLVTRVEYSYLSSSVVKEIAKFNGDISCFVPQYVQKKISEKLGVL